MMTQLSQTLPTSNTQGLDVIEALAERNGWPLERLKNGDLIMESQGDYGLYTIHFAWSKDHHALHISCDIDFTLPATAHDAVSALTNQINARLWIGHFALAASDHCVSYRHTLIVHHADDAKAMEAEEIIQTALGECDRFYPAFQFVAFQGMSADQAMTCALWDCVGHA